MIRIAQPDAFSQWNGWDRFMRLLRPLQPLLRPLRPLRYAPLAALLTACATVDLSAPTSASRPGAALPGAPAPAVTPPVSSAEESALRALVAQQDRLYRVAGPLLINNADLCRSHARNLLGFTAKNKYSYSAEFVNAAQTLFQMGEPLKVMGVLAGSGAARAGLRRGDDLLMIEDKPLPTGPNAERLASGILAPLVTGRSSVKVMVARNGANLPLTVPLTYACAFGIELGNTDNVVAYNDGQRILVTRGMLNFARTDDELAYVMAKEMAHNALAHAARQRVTATSGGIIDNLVRIRPDMGVMVGLAGLKPVTQDLDAAADRTAIFMLARAGYNIDNAIPFWQRLAAQYPADVLNGYTALHPATTARMAAMDKAVKDVRTLQGTKKPLFP